MTCGKNKKKSKKTHSSHTMYQSEPMRNPWCHNQGITSRKGRQFGISVKALLTIVQVHSEVALCVIRNLRLPVAQDLKPMRTRRCHTTSMQLDQCISHVPSLTLTPLPQTHIQFPNPVSTSTSRRRLIYIQAADAGAFVQLGKRPCLAWNQLLTQKKEGENWS